LVAGGAACFIGGEHTAHAGDEVGEKGVVLKCQHGNLGGYRGKGMLIEVRGTEGVTWEKR
jgi:hypothetical protein